MNNIIENIINSQKDFFKKGDTLEYKYRISALKKLRDCIIKYEEDILSALKEDLNKSSFEGYITELGMVLLEINFVLKNLKRWVRRKRVKTPIFMFHSKSYIIKEPYGVSLIISPWNYPFQLAMMPLIGSISAGNCSIIKPSEYAIKTAKIIEKIITEVFPSNYCACILGDHEVGKEILTQKFDFIFFTGSSRVGKIVYQAASQNLTPVCLELGGKSPCIIDKSANLVLASRRIAFGKFLNSGQTCVAPDYVLIEKSVKEEFIKQLIDHIIEFFGPNPLDNPNIPKIISKNHFNRLISLLDNVDIIHGGKSKNNEVIEPTIIDNVLMRDKIMEDEIFGPILPIISFNTIEEVIDLLKSKDKPLALYLFTNSTKTKEMIINNISFGGGCINDTLMHLSNPYLPFGGVGNSGLGQYHGKYSFDTFSHQKSINIKSNFIDLSVRYHPYNEKKKRLIKKIIK